MKTIRTAIFGTGFMGRVHLEGLRRTPGVEVVAIVGRERSSAEKLGAGFGIPAADSDYRKVLDDKSIDAVHICTPNGLHYQMAKDALQAGKHVLCEKPITRTVEEAAELVRLAADRKLRNCVCHNLRYYPMVQQMRRMREEGTLGRILMVQGTYSQDWLLYDTDWNWRIETEAGALRTMADVGTHWFDMAEHITGLRVDELCADLQTFFPKRKRPPQNTGGIDRRETVEAKTLEEVDIKTEDYGAVIFHMGNFTRGSMTASQVSGGRKNQLSIEVYGTEASVGWNQERPDELWIGRRNGPNHLMLKDPSSLQQQAATYADLPGGHSEGYDDTFKQVFRRFYASILNSEGPADYPQFVDGLRHMQIMQAELESHTRRGWQSVPQL